MANALQRYREMPKGDLAAKLARTVSTLTKTRQEVERSKLPSAILGTGVAGSAGLLTGAVQGWREEVAGVPVDAALTIGALVGGLALRQPLMVHAAGGPLAVFLARLGREFVEERMTAPE